MAKYDNCIACFEPLNGMDRCPHCNCDVSSYTPPPHCLKPFTVLANRYLIGRTVGRGGFGATYVSLDLKRNLRVAVKEFLPADYSIRDKATLRVIPTEDGKKIFEHGKEKFLDEARALQKFMDNPAIVDVLGYLSANNTSYIIMEYLDGVDLQKMATRNGGRLELSFALDAFRLIASALVEIHRSGILHRDLTPGNLFYTKDGQFKVFDFGSARDYIQADKMGRGLSVYVTPGYAPPEQYSKNGNQGPWTDVFGLSASFYRLVSGVRPVGDIKPLYQMNCGVSRPLSNIIERGMEPDLNKRYQSFGVVLDDLDKVKMPPKPSQLPKPPQPRFLKRIIDRSGGASSKNTDDGQNKIVSGQNEAEGGRNKVGSGNPRKETAFVKVLTGPERGRKNRIPPNQSVVIGRERNCFIVIGDAEKVSRHHCSVSYDDHAHVFYVTDSSTNGTFTESGQRIPSDERRELKAGDKIYLAAPDCMLLLDTE